MSLIYMSWVYTLTKCKFSPLHTLTVYTECIWQVEEWWPKSLLVRKQYHRIMFALMVNSLIFNSSALGSMVKSILCHWRWTVWRSRKGTCFSGNILRVHRDRRYCWWGGAELKGLCLESYQASLLLSLWDGRSETAVSGSCRCILGAFLLTIVVA